MAERPIPQNVAKATYPEMAAQECIALADMMQLELGRKTTDVLDQLTNTDFQGDFFRIGDTVQVVGVNPNSIKVVEGDKDDLRPTLNKLAFTMNTMTIDKERKFGFQIKDLERIEDKWNHESAAHALAARKMREADARGVLELIATNDKIRVIGLNNPINLATVGGGSVATGMFKLVNRMKSELKKVGALDQAVQYTFGTNKTVPLRGTASLFLAPTLYRELLNSQVTRVDDVMEDVIQNGKYEKYLGFLLNEAPELDPTEPTALAALAAIQPAAPSTTKVGLVIMGTKNAVTRANKVLPPEKMRDYVHFADNYYGREIFGQMVACADAVIVARVILPDDGLTPEIAAGADDAVLFTNFGIENPVEANDAEDRFYPNEGYQAQDLTSYAKKTDVYTRTQTDTEINAAVTLGIAGHRHDEGTLAANTETGAIDGLTGPGEAVQEETQGD